MSCSYCNFGAHNQAKDVMDPQIAVNAVDYMVDWALNTGKNEYVIQFFGGEPFIEDDIIDISVHHARLVSSKVGVYPIFAASTNGMFNIKRAEFIGDYFDMIVLSLDGFKEFHNHTRPKSNEYESFSDVVKSARYLSQTQLDFSIRCCITQESAEHMNDFALWFCDEFRPSSINFEPVTENPVSKRAGVRSPDPYLFAKNWVTSRRLIEEQGYPLISPVASVDAVQNTSCPLGQDATIVMPTGKIAACYLSPNDWEAKNLDLYFGEVSPNGSVYLDDEKIKKIRRLTVEKPRCINCFCRFSCAGGCHVNQTGSKCPNSYNSFCIHTRVISASNLLDSLGLSEISDALLSSLDAMKKLALQQSDFLCGPEIDYDN